MARRWLVFAALLLSACAPTEPHVANWFSETFALGSPLRDQSGDWVYSDGGKTSQYTKLTYAIASASTNNPEVHDTNGRGGSPALYSSDTTAGRTASAIFALSGTASSRNLSPLADAGSVVLDFYVQFVGANAPALHAYLYSSPSIWNADLDLYFRNSGTFGVVLQYRIPNGVNFGTDGDSSTYSIGALNCWRGDGLWHHIRVEARAGTVTTWTPGTFNDENDYTGGDLVVTSDGWLKLYIDDEEVISIAGAPFIMNFDGQDANESSPGSWVTAARLVEANVNRVSLFEAGIVGGSSYLDDITVGGAQAWVDWPNFKVKTVDFGRYPGGAARVTCAMWAKDAGVTMKARLYDITNAASLAESAEVTSQTETDATFSVTSTGQRRVKLQVTADVPETDLFGAPGAEVGP